MHKDGKGKFKSMKEYETKVENSDYNWLLDKVQKAIVGMSTKIYVQANLHKALMESPFKTIS